MSTTFFFHLKTLMPNKKTKTTTKFFNFLTYSVFIILVSANLCSQNLLTNGGFEGGGSTNGFFINQYGLINLVNGTSTPANMLLLLIQV
jgi:hypothetical protein